MAGDDDVEEGEEEIMAAGLCGQWCLSRAEIFFYWRAFKRGALKSWRKEKWDIVVSWEGSKKYMR
jgi:hypothetical protein